MKEFIPLTPEYGIVIRKDALAERSVTAAALYEALEVERPLAESTTLLSFGPHFGQEAADEMHRRLLSVGLQYVDDFFVFAPEVPTWCAFAVDIA